MKKIIIFLIAIVFLTNCGYTPIYSNKNLNFKLEKIISSKNSQLNSIVQRRLVRFTNQEGGKEISLKLDSQKKISVLAKNSKGDPSRYEMIIEINLEITYDQNQSINQSFQEAFNYNGNTNKFELNQYESEIEDLLINKNIERIITYLSKI